MEVAPMARINGIYCWHFVMKGKTTKFVDLFYKLRNRVDAYADKNLTRSILYVEKKRGSKEKDKRIEFDWKQLEASYIKNGRLRRTTKIRPRTFDPLSVFYYFRLQALTPGAVIRVPVSDGKKWVLGEAAVVRPEKVMIDGKTYHCVLVEPDLKHVGGIFHHGQGSKSRIWFTADSGHIPVKIETKVSVGSFYMELTPL